MSTYRDFDAAWAELENEGLKFKAKGQEYTIPASIPAKTMLRLISLYRKYGTEKNIPEIEQMDLAITVLGQDVVDDLCERGMTANELAEVVTWAFARYRGEPEETEGEESPNPKAPKRGKK